MVILLRIYKLIMNITYFFFKLMPTKKNRIIFLSRQDNVPSIDFIYMIDDINKRYPNYEVKVLCKRMEKTNLKQIISYVLHPFEQLYYLATSSICITDGYQMTISPLKHKKDLKIIQIWHSLGAVKKFGYQIIKTEKEKKIAKIMKMHKGYDVIFSGSESMTPYFAKAFNYDETKFVPYGLPRIDYLLKTKKENKEKVYKKYPNLKNKKVVLYVPTFRTYDEYKIEELIKEFRNSKYELIIKKHPRMKVVVPKKYSYEKVSSLELLSIADFVVTDYSAISIEAAILDKPVILYTYDYEKYNEIEGINPNIYEDLPGYVFNTAEEVFKCIKENKYDKDILKRYKEKYVTNTDGTATKKIVDYILGGKNEEEN